MIGRASRGGGFSLTSFLPFLIAGGLLIGIASYGQKATQLAVVEQLRKEHPTATTDELNVMAEAIGKAGAVVGIIKSAIPIVTAIGGLVGVGSVVTGVVGSAAGYTAMATAISSAAASAGVPSAFSVVAAKAAASAMLSATASGATPVVAANAGITAASTSMGVAISVIAPLAVMALYMYGMTKLFEWIDSDQDRIRNASYALAAQLMSGYNENLAYKDVGNSQFVQQKPEFFGA